LPPGYSVDDDDDGPPFRPVPGPFLPKVDVRWRGGSVWVGPGRIHVKTYPVPPRRFDHDTPLVPDDHGKLYVPPPDRHDGHRDGHNDGHQDGHRDSDDVPPPPAVDQSQHTFPGPRIPGAQGDGDHVRPAVVEQPRGQVVAPRIEVGQFVVGDVPLYPRVKVSDIDDAHPRAVPRIMAIRNPSGRGMAFVKVLAPPVPPSDVDTDDDGRKLKLEWGDYSVEVESDDGRIEIDYDN
jgi:hypothetical protein